MCDSFDMACRDASNALQVNIKVNSENLLPNSQKYNVGSLRIPADPSWPKIPQRKLLDDLNDVIEPPCIVTLTGTPRKSRTTVRPHSLSRSNFTKDQVPGTLHHNIYQKIVPPSQPIKRRPGCADPRFKKVTTVKSQMTSTDSPDRERENPTELSRSAVIIPNQTECPPSENVRKTVPEKDTDPPKVTQQEAEKPGEIRGMDSIGVQTMSNERPASVERKNDSKDFDVSKQAESIDEAKNHGETFGKHCKNEENNSCRENSPSAKTNFQHVKNGDQQEAGKISENIDVAKEENPPSNATIVPKNPTTGVPQSESPCFQCCQGNNTGQLFLVVDNKAQAPSFGALQIDGNSVKSCQYTTQCYNVQVPVLSYQNLPLQISTQQGSRVDVSSQLSLSPVLTIPSTPSINSGHHHHHHHHHHQFDMARGNISRISEVPESASKGTSASVDDYPRSNVRSGDGTVTSNDKRQDNKIAMIEEGSNGDKISSDVQAQRSRKMLATPPIKLEQKYDTKYDGISENFKASRAQHLLSDTTDSEMYGGTEIKQPKQPISRRPSLRPYSKETSGSGSDYDVNTEMQFRDNDIDQQTRKKKRKPIYCSTPVSQEGIYSRNYESTKDRESSMDGNELSRLREDIRTSRNHRKMKSEQNLPRTSAFGEKSYKNTSDPHLTLRDEARGIKDGGGTRALANAGRKNDERISEITRDKEASFNPQNHDVTTDDSDAPNLPDCCDTHRTDLSNIEETKNNRATLTNNETTSIPVKTQQLLNKSYMEYYDKLRSNDVVGNAQQRYICQMAMGAPQLKKRRAEINPDAMKIGDKNDEKIEVSTMEKLSALSNIINRNLNPSLRNTSDPMQTKQLYVNENMKSLADPITAGTQRPITMREIIANENSADLYESSVASSTLVNKVKRKREKPVERRLLKLKTIAFFGFTMYAMIVLLPMMYTYFSYDDYEDYEDLSYAELIIDYVVSSFREAFGGLFDTINDMFFRPFLMIFSAPVGNVTALLKLAVSTIKPL